MIYDASVRPNKAVDLFMQPLSDDHSDTILPDDLVTSKIKSNVTCSDPLSDLYLRAYDHF